MSKEVLAQQLFDSGDVQKVNDDTFVCHGSNGNQYEIQRVNDPQYNYEFYCKCPAWKFDTSRRCKHVLAVQLLEKSGGGSVTRPSHTHSIQQKSVAQIKAQGAKAKAKKGKYTTKKRTKADLKSENTTEWIEPDGSKTEFKFDEHGNLIGKEKK